MPQDHSSSEAGRTVDLKLVDEAAGYDALPGANDSSAGPGRSDSWVLPAWLFVVALIVFFLVIGWQAKVASQLESKVEGLERELVQTTALLEGHRTHLEEIRGGVRELSAHFAGLRTLVERGPDDSDDPAATAPDILEPTP